MNELFYIGGAFLFSVACGCFGFLVGRALDQLAKGE